MITTIGKARMYFFKNDHFIWNMVENGYELPIIVVEGVRLPKPEDKWNEDNMK